MVAACLAGRRMQLVAGWWRAPLSTGHPEHHTNSAIERFAAEERNHRVSYINRKKQTKGAHAYIHVDKFLYSYWQQKEEVITRHKCIMLSKQNEYQHY